MDKFCEDNGFCTWFETSAKDNINIDTAAMTLVQNILNTREQEDYQPDTDSILLDNQKKFSDENECRC